MLKTIIIGALVLVGMFVLIVAVTGGPEEASPTARIEAACLREYPGDQGAQARCQVGLIERTLDNDASDRMKRAAHEAGVR